LIKARGTRRALRIRKGEIWTELTKLTEFTESRGREFGVDRGGGRMRGIKVDKG